MHSTTDHHATIERLRRISESVLSLPTLPTIQARLLEMVDNPRVTGEDLGRVIAEDQAVTARILKACNSAYYGLQSEVTSVERAVVLLGFDTVRELSVSVSVLQYFRLDATLGGFDPAHFWEHSAAVGSIARWLAKRFQPAIMGEAYLGGLLHDLGKLILMQYFPKDFTECLLGAAQGQQYLYEVEADYLGVDHAQVGAWLAAKWKLPAAVCDCIAFHHCPWLAEERQSLVAAVSLANLLAQYSQLGDSGNRKLPLLDGPMFKTLKLYFPIEQEGFMAEMVRAVHTDIQSEMAWVRELMSKEQP
jgi:putative nucleotidyltransferase with HDIG domain